MNNFFDKRNEVINVICKVVVFGGILGFILKVIF